MYVSIVIYDSGLYAYCCYYRWPTRVFATDCLKRIVIACEEDQTHFDLEKARETRKITKGKVTATVIEPEIRFVTCMIVD